MLHPMFDSKQAKHFEATKKRIWKPKVVISFSGGKDSTAMLLKMVEQHVYHVHAVLFFDTGWEFPEMYEHLDKVEQQTSLKITRIKPTQPFNDLLRKYRWPDMRRRWCTSQKTGAIRKYINQHFPGCYVVEAIGFAADEKPRTIKKGMQKRKVVFPLIEQQQTEKDALAYCKERGFDWNGLYDHFDRLSCFCCPLQNKRELETLRKTRPDMWGRMLDMENSIPTDKHYVTFKGRKTLHQIDRFLEIKSKQLSILDFIARRYS